MHFTTPRGDDVQWIRKNNGLKKRTKGDCVSCAVTWGIFSREVRRGKVITLLKGHALRNLLATAPQKQVPAKRRRMGCGGSNAASTVSPEEASPRRGASPNPARAAAKAGLHHPPSAPHLAANEGAPKGASKMAKRWIERRERYRDTAKTSADLSSVSLKASRSCEPPAKLKRESKMNKAVLLGKIDGLAARRRRKSVAEVYPLRSWLNPPSTLNPQPSPLNPRPSTFNPRPSTLDLQPPTLNLQPAFNPQPSTLNPQRSTLNPQPSTLNPQPSTLDHEPRTLRHKPQTLSPKPLTLNPEP